jgi:hypothetical protein
MVSFIADPRIKRAAQQRQLMLARALQPYKLPKNPYGGSPIAGNLQRLAEGYLAGQAGKRATSLEKAQKDAQAKVMAQILQLQQLPAGSTLNITETAMPISDMDMVQRRQQQVSRRPYSTEMPTISAEVLETAGLSPAGFQLAAQKARTAGRTAYTAAQKEELEAGLVEALRSPDPASRALARQYQTLLDPSAVALREVEERDVRERKELSQEGAASYRINWAFDRKTKKLVPVSDLERKENPERYAPVPETTDLGPIPAWVGKTYNALDEQAALAQRAMHINANMKKLVTTGGLTTGALQPLFTKFKGVMADLGFDIKEDLNAAQVLDAMSSGKALDVRNPKSGQGLPGATSDKDLDFLVKIVPALSKTNFANEALIIIDTALNRRKLQSLQLKMKWISQNPHKGLIGYKSDAADKVLQDMDLFTKDEKARLDQLLQAPKITTNVTKSITTETKSWKPYEAGE